MLCVGLYDGTVSVYDVRSKKQARLLIVSLTTLDAGNYLSYLLTYCSHYRPTYHYI